MQTIPDAWKRGVTPSGQTITCDGCKKPTGPVDESMVHDIRLPGISYAPGTKFIVCKPPADGSNPCLVLAELDESMLTPAGPDCGCASCLTSAGRHI